MAVQIQEATLSSDVALERAAVWKRRPWIGLLFVLPFFVFYGAFLIWPTLFMLRMSFTSWSLTGAGTDNIIGLANYRELFSDDAFWTSLRNTLWFTVLSTPPLVILSLVFALLANQAIPGRWFFRLSFFAPYVLPSSVVVIIWSWIYQPTDFGFLNGYLTQLGLEQIGWLTDTDLAMISVVITTVWWTIGFNFILYLAGLQEIPRDLYEAAELDGAGQWRLVRDITIPLLNRTTLTILILQLLASLKVFEQIFLLTGGGPNFTTRPIIQYIYETGFTSYRIGLAAAMSYVFFVIIILVSIIQFVVTSRRGDTAQ